MKENRHHPRHDCHIPVCFFTGTQQGEAVITNLSRGGVRISCRPHRTLTGIIGLSSLPGETPQPTRFGLIAWSEENAPDGHVYGLRLCRETDWLEKVLLPWNSAPRLKGSLGELSLNLEIESAMA